LTLAKPGAVIPAQPTIEGPEITSFEGEQDADGYQFAGIELGLRMFVDFGQHVVYQAENV
jgi:hypothetical protein